MDLDALVESGLRVGVSSEHGIDGGTRRQLDRQRSADPFQTVIGQQRPIHDNFVPLSGSVMKARWPRRNPSWDCTGVRSAMADNDQAGMVVGIAFDGPHFAAGYILPSPDHHVTKDASLVVGLLVANIRAASASGGRRCACCQSA